ncbi:MAG TPA: archaeosine tRNA-ribosyltransferase, partial [Methanobacterium sp.]
EINLHDGPARLGKYQGQETPGILSPDSPIPFIPDEPMPFNVPKPLAEFSVNRTLEKGKKSSETGIAVIHGSKYPELRIHCALELEKLGNHILLVANPEELLNRPMDLIKILVKLRENINPNTALYFPFVKTPFIPLLAYLGVDFFGSDSNNFYAQLGQITTPHKIYDLKNYQLYQFNQDELSNYNQNNMDFVLREVRENIRNKTLRNLVEERCCSSPETMTALRILDRDYREYLDRYTSLY